jgi:4-hydroxyphenylpyruvate dioxygenase
MRTGIATVCLSGALDDKLFAARDAGFDGVEVFEPDLIASPLSPETVRDRAADLGLSLDLYQPFRDFEGVSSEQLKHNLTRAEAKFALMRRLGTDTMLLCSNVATARSGDEHLAAAHLRQLGDLASAYGVRVAYEALAWGRFVDSYEQAARIVRLADHDLIGVCLDSFHILSKGHSPEAIETIGVDKIFFVQVADAPILSMDVLSWSRHHRLFPGEGGFDLGRFMGHLARTGYDGPVSLEVFNDTYRQSDPFATAVDARRSLRWLEHVAAEWLASNPQAADTRMTTSELPAVAPPSEFSYVELRSRDLEETRSLLDQIGFASHGTHRSKPVELWTQGDARVVLGEPGAPGTPTVAGIGLSVRDPELAIQRARELFADDAEREERVEDETLLGVRAPDGSEVFFGREASAEPRWVAEFGQRQGQDSPLVEGIDHVNLAQPWQWFDAGVLFFRSVLDLSLQPSTEVAAPVGLVRSQVLRTADGAIRLALNLVPPAARRDEILPQHIAFRSPDVLALARQARSRGFEPLAIPGNYYDDLEARYEIDPQLLAELRELNVMYDRDDAGEFLHFYTRPVGTVFLELVERRGAYEGYGALNAPVRLAAQYQQRARATDGVAP